MTEQPSVKHSTTTTEHDIFHQLGHLRHNVSNTDFKRSTDRSTLTERLQSRDLAVNTEPKIMYSKDVGDFDVRIGNEESEKEYVEHQEFTWNTSYGRRAPLHSQSTTFERGFQTDLHDTKREVGYIHRPLKQYEDSIEEQRQEIITFRLPQQPPETTTEETYETTITADRKQTNQQFEEEIRNQMKYDNVNTTTIKSETTEWTRPLGSSTMKTSIASTKQDRTRSHSPEELVEESYEVVSTLTKPHDTEFLTTSGSPRSTVTSSTQRFVDLSAGKLPSSEDDSSYCEEWTVTEAKRKQDGHTVKTIIDR